MANKDMKNLARRLIDISLGDLVEFKEGNKEGKEEEEKTDSLDMKFSGKPGEIQPALYDRVFGIIINVVVVITAFAELLLTVLGIAFICFVASDIFQHRGDLSMAAFITFLIPALKVFGYILLTIAGVFVVTVIGILFLVVLKKVFAFLEMIYLRLNISKNYLRTKNKLEKLDEEDKKRKQEKEANRELKNFLKQAESGKEAITPHPKG
jgi:hypothetical protein